MNFVGLSDTSWIVLQGCVAAVVLYLVWNGIRIRHPERSRGSILTFVVVTFLIPPASHGLAYLSYQNGVSIIPAVGLFVILSGLGCWYLCRTIRRPPRWFRKAGSGTVEPPAPYQLAVTRLSTAAVHVLKGVARASVFCGSAGRGASASYPGGMRHSVHGELAGHMAVARYSGGGGGGVMLSSLAVGRSAVADWLRRQTERQPLGSNWTAGKGELRRSHCRLPPASS